MNIFLASSAELYREHRRTASARKKQRIAAELQRRHDELNCRPGYRKKAWWCIELVTLRDCFGVRLEHRLRSYHRFDFALELPGSPPSSILDPLSSP